MTFNARIPAVSWTLPLASASLLTIGAGYHAGMGEFWHCLAVAIAATILIGIQHVDDGGFKWAKSLTSLASGSQSHSGRYLSGQ